MSSISNNIKKIKVDKGWFVIGRTYLPGDFYDSSELDYHKHGHSKLRPGIILKIHGEFLLVSFFSSKSKNKMLKEELEKQFKNLKKIPNEKEYKSIIENLTKNSIKSNDKKYFYYPDLTNGFLMWVHISKINYSNNEYELKEWFIKNWNESESLTGKQKDIYEEWIKTDKLKSVDKFVQKKILAKEQFSKKKLKNSLTPNRAALKIYLMATKRYDINAKNVKKDFIKGKECFTINPILIIDDFINDEIEIKSSNKFIIEMNDNLKEK